MKSLAVLVCLLAAAPAFAAELPVVKHHALDGADLYTVSRPGTEYAATIMMLGSGPAEDPAEQQGLGMLTLWAMGAGEFRFAEGMPVRREFAGNYSAWVSQGRYVLSWQSDQLANERIFAELGPTLRSPALPEDWLATAQDNVAIAFVMRDTDPRNTAQRIWRRLALGDHPSGQPVLGTPKTVSDLTRNDYVARAGEMWRRRSKIFVVGPPVRHLPDALDDALRSRSTAEYPPPTSDPLPEGAALIVLHRTGLQQAYVVAGSAATEARPDTAALLALEKLLGAGIWGRLDQNLRVSGAATYGFVPSAEFLPGVQTLRFGAWVRADQAVGAVSALRSTLEGVVGDAPPTTEEVAAAAAGLETTLLLELASNTGCADVLQRLSAYGRDPTDLQGWIDDLRALTPERVTAAAKALIDPASFSIVVAGDATELAEPLVELGLDQKVVGQKKKAATED